MHRERGPYTHRVKRGRIALLAAIMTAAAIAVSLSPCHAQQPSLESINFAFSTQLGSGIYAASGTTIQIYRISLARRLRESTADRWGCRAALRTTIGFYNFNFEDILDTPLPDNVGTLAVVPEIELETPRWRQNWNLLPFIGVGGGKDFQGGEFNWIFATGVRSRLIWPWRASTHIRLGNELVYSMALTDKLDFSDDFGLMQTVLDLRRPIGLGVWGHTLDGSIYGGNYLYFVSPKFVEINGPPLHVSTNWEMGVTLGTVEPWRVLGIQMPRIGIGYRFDTQTGFVRLLIGETVPIYPSLKRSASFE